MDGSRPTARLTRRSVLGAALATPFAFASNAALAGTPRVIALDYALAEQLIVLGVEPIAISDAHDWNRWVVDPPLPASTVNLGNGVAPNIELMASLKPDLVLTTDYVALVEPQITPFARVERFSINSPGGSPLPKAAAAMRRMGELLSIEDRAAAYLDETDRFFEASAERAKPFRDVPILLLSFLDPRHARVYSRPGVQQDVLDRLGLTNAWTGEGGPWGFETAGLERLAEVGDAFAIADHMPPDVRDVLEASPLWRELPIRRDTGPIPVLPPVLAFGGVPGARRLAGLILDALEERLS